MKSEKLKLSTYKSFITTYINNDFDEDLEQIIPLSILSLITKKIVEGKKNLEEVKKAPLSELLDQCIAEIEKSPEYDDIFYIFYKTVMTRYRNINPLLHDEYIDPYINVITNIMNLNIYLSYLLGVIGREDIEKKTDIILYENYNGSKKVTFLVKLLNNISDTFNYIYMSHIDPFIFTEEILKHDKTLQKFSMDKFKFSKKLKDFSFRIVEENFVKSDYEFFKLVKLSSFLVNDFIGFVVSYFLYNLSLFTIYNSYRYFDFTKGTVSLNEIKESFIEGVSKAFNNAFDYGNLSIITNIITSRPEFIDEESIITSIVRNTNGDKVKIDEKFISDDYDSYVFLRETVQSVNLLSKYLKYLSEDNRLQIEDIERDGKTVVIGLSSKVTPEDFISFLAYNSTENFMTTFIKYPKMFYIHPFIMLPKIPSVAEIFRAFLVKSFSILQ